MAGNRDPKETVSLEDRFFILGRVSKVWLQGVLLLILFVNPSFAQMLAGKEPSEQTSPGEKDGPNGVELNKDYLRGYITDTQSILTSPLRWEKGDWLKASLVAAVTMGLYAYDQNIQDWVQKNRNTITDDVAKLVTPFGNGFVILPALGVFYLYGCSEGDKRARSTALLSLESLVLSSVFTGALKFTTHRYRPNEENPYNKWDGPSFSTSHLSFPSWQSSSAFAIGTVIASEYSDKVWVPPLAYGIATLTGLARIHNNDHWASDVFLGSAIGFFTAKAIVALHKKDIDLAVMPVIEDQFRGLALFYQF